MDRNQAIWNFALNKYFGYNTTSSRRLEPIAKDQKYTVFEIFFYFAKEFYLVDHEVLVQKLEKQLSRWFV